MAAAWLDERPRQLAVPLPTPMHSAAKSCGSGRASTGETIKALREKLSEYQAENSLLGTLVKELKVERDGLQKKLAAVAKQHSDASSRAATAQHQVDAVGKDQKRLAAEVERLSSVVHSHSVRLQKAKAHQKELEDVALDMRAELDEARSKQEAAEQAAAAAAQRATAAEAKLEAAGMGAMPKMGPTAEQLVINSTQRIRELLEELASLKAAGEQQLADAQQQVQLSEKQWCKQLDAAQASAQEAQQQLERRLQQQEWQLEQQSKRAEESEQQCRSLQQQVLQLQQSLREAQLASEACTELERSRQSLSSSNQALQQQVAQLQQQLAERQTSQAASLADLQQSTAALQRDKQQLSASLAAIRQAETAHRLTSTEAGSKIERLRSELLRCVGELQAQLTASATAGQQQQQAQQQLRALEAAAAAARTEAAESRQQLVELASVTLTELREQVAGESVAITGLPDDMGEQIPAPVANYIKVLEHAVCDCERRSKQLLEDALTAQHYERDARQALATARDGQASAERALQQQTQRLLAAERMRLSDLKEQQSLEKRLALAQQECSRLRDTLLNCSTNSSSSWQQELGLNMPLAGTATSSPPGCSYTQTGATSSPPGCSYSATARAAGSAAAFGADANSPTKWALSLTQQRTGPGSPGDGACSSANVATGAAAGTAVGGATNWGAQQQQQQQQQPPAAPSASNLPAGGWQGGLSSWQLKQQQQPPPPPPQQQPQASNGLGAGLQPSTAAQGPGQQQQQQQEDLWQLPAADAGQASADVAAHSAASINRYQAKLAQLRQMKEQLIRRTVTCLEPAAAGGCTSSSSPATHSPAAGDHQQQGCSYPQQGQNSLRQQPQLRESMLTGHTQPTPLPMDQLPPVSALVWTPRSVQDDWLIGAGSSAGLHSSGRPSMDHSAAGFSDGRMSSVSLGAAQSSSGGGSHSSGWSLPGRAPGGGVGGSAGGVAAGSKLSGPSRLGASAQRGAAVAAAGSGMYPTGGTPGEGEGGGEQGQQTELGQVSSMKEWVKAATAAGAAGGAAAGSSGSGGNAGAAAGHGSRRSSRERSDSGNQARQQQQQRQQNAGSAARGDGGADGLLGSGYSSLSSSSNLQRWAQPHSLRQQQQQQEQQPGFERQPRGSSAAGSRRSTSSARSSQA